MKIGVISDSHGSNTCLLLALKTLGKVDMVLHAGDHFKDIKTIKELIDVPIIGVGGNCDFRGPDEELVELPRSRKLLLTHGHKYGVKYSLNRIAYRGEELGVQVVVFGHTHIPVNEKLGDILLFNPGSPTRPRGLDLRPTCGLLEIEEEIKGYILPLDNTK